MADRSATRKRPHLILLIAAIILCTQAPPLWSADSRRVATVPALGLLADGQTGIVHYIVLQIDRDPRQEGPTVQFNEINLGGGSIVSEDWKEGVRHAVTAATNVKSDVALTGKIMPDGQIESVDAVLIKVEAAARAQFKTILIPRGQLDKADWNLSQLTARWNIKVIEVATLEEAYQLMTTARR